MSDENDTPKRRTFSCTRVLTSLMLGVLALRIALQSSYFQQHYGVRYSPRVDWYRMAVEYGFSVSFLLVLFGLAVSYANLLRCVKERTRIARSITLALTTLALFVSIFYWITL